MSEEGQRVWDEAIAAMDEITPTIDKLRHAYEEECRTLEALRLAVDEMTNELDLFLDCESRTLDDLRTALALLKAAR
jgi:hypothetical protein